MKKVFFIILVILILAVLFLFFKSYPLLKSSNSPRNNFSLTSLTNLKNITWSSAKQNIQQTFYGKINGQVYTALTTSTSAQFPSFENKNELSKLNFQLDNNLAASGPGSNVWGYKKITNGKTQIILYSYSTQPTSNNANEPLQFNCPCKVTLTIFLSNSFNTNDHK